MRKLQLFRFGRIAVAALILVALLPGAQATAAQTGDSTYTFEDHDVTVEWTSQWNPALPGPGSPVLSLERDKSIFVLISVWDGAELSPEEAVWVFFEETDEIVDDRSTETPPRVDGLYGDTGVIYSAEAYELNGGDTTVLALVGTIPTLQSAALEIAQEEISINGSPVLTGQPLGESTVPDDITGATTPETESRSTRSTRGTSVTTTATEEATEVATEETSRTTRSTRGTAETPEATEESGSTTRSTRGTAVTPEATEESTIVRTSRTGSSGAETPEATEEVTEVATEVPTEEQTAEPTEETGRSLGMETYINELFGFSFEYNPNIWQQAESDAPDELVRLDGETGTVLFWAVDFYGTDPVACLTGESEYWEFDDDSTSNWEVALDANGDPLWSEGADLSWGVFTYTYTSETSGNTIEFVDYISCETIPGQDALLIVHLTSLPEEYNTNLDYVLDILDTLEFQP